MGKRDEGHATRDRLIAHARSTSMPVADVFQRYLVERILLAIGSAARSPRLSLHGAWSFAVWFDTLPRRTHSLDLVDLDRTSPSQLVTSLAEAIGSISGDGLRVDFSAAQTVSWTQRRSPLHRISTAVHMGPTTLPLRINVMAPRRPEPAVEVRYMKRPLLTATRPRIACYTIDEMVAEKAALLVTYGPDHTRLQDLFDLAHLARRCTFSGTVLAEAVAATFEGRDAARMLQRQDGYWWSAFDPSHVTRARRTRWLDFLQRAQVSAPLTGLHEVVADVANFLNPLLRALKAESGMPFIWHPSRGWHSPLADSSAAWRQVCLPFGEMAGRLGAYPGARRAAACRGSPALGDKVVSVAEGDHGER